MNEARSPESVFSQPRVVRAPLVLPAVAMVCGVVVGRWVGLSTGAYLAAGLLCVAGSVVAWRRAHLHAVATGLLLVGIVGLSAAYARGQWQGVDEGDVVQFTRDDALLARIEGRIETAPAILRDADGPPLPYKRSDRTVFVLAVERIYCAPDWRPVGGLVRVRVDGPCERLRAGQRVRLDGWFGRFGPPRNPGQADARELARQNRVLAWASVPTADGVEVLGGPPSAMERLYWNVRCATRQHLAATNQEDDGRLITALIAGDRHPALATLNESMKRSGVAHYLSISGTHLAIFLGFIYGLCRLAQLRPRPAAVVVLIVLAAYVSLTEPGPPLLRSAIMATALCLAVLFHRQHSALNAFSAAAIVLLLLDPLDLFSPGFQLSFSIVLGMMLLSVPLRDALFGRWRRRRGLAVFRDGRPARRWLTHRAAEWGMTAVAVGLAAYLASVPLVAYHFGLFSPYAGLLTILLAPLITAVLVPAYLSLMLLWPLPNLAHAVGQVAGFFSDVVVRCVYLMEYLPGLCVPVRPVSVVWVVLAYAALGAWLIRDRLPWRWGLSLVLTLTLAGLTVHTQRGAEPPPGARLHVLAVGQGQAAVLHLPDGSTAVFDAGTAGGFDLHAHTLEPFFRAQRLAWSDTIFVSHAHLDHCSGLVSLIRDHPPKKVYLGPYFTPDRPMEAPAQQLLAMLRQRGIATEIVRPGQRVTLDPRTHVDVLWPPEDSPIVRDVNDSSLVLKITCDGQSVLLPGDIGEKPIRELLAWSTATTQPAATRPAAEKPAPANRFAPANPLQADVLMLPHHGGWNSALPSWLIAVGPRHVVVSGGRDMSAALEPTGPRTEFYRGLLSREYYPTWWHGCVSITFGEGNVTVQTMR